MNRISTAGNYQSALLNLMTAQNQQKEAQTRVSTRKIATDMAGFGRGAESLTALKATQSRAQGFLDTGDAVAARLESQDLSLNRIGDAITSARAAIGTVLSSDSANVLMLELEGQFQSVQNGLNAQHQGNFLFAGADSANAPVTVTSLADLSAAPSVAATFGNDNLRPTSRLSESTSVQTGYLASDVGTAIFQVFRDIQQYQEGTAVTITDAGPPAVTTTYTPDPNPALRLTGKPSDAVKTFLTAQLKRLDAAGAGVLDSISRNGSLQKQVETTNAGHAAQVASLEDMVSKKTDADLAQAITDLQLAQVAVQASAQVISQLSQVSLLNYLR